VVHSSVTYVVGICAFVVASQACPPLIAGNYTTVSRVQPVVQVSGTHSSRPHGTLAPAFPIHCTAFVRTQRVWKGEGGHSRHNAGCDDNIGRRKKTVHRLRRSSQSRSPVGNADGSHTDSNSGSLAPTVLERKLVSWDKSDHETAGGEPLTDIPLGLGRAIRVKISAALSQDIGDGILTGTRAVLC
jgi:hypothetical protein